MAPPPLRGSGQKHRETWRQFFTRHQLRNDDVTRHETSQSRGKREQCAQHAKAGKAPGRKGANIFYWDECEWRASHPNTSGVQQLHRYVVQIPWDAMAV
ncbi:hypothetical protein J3R82DRAFT_3384 [Butyriboletus roseoflavus]|nr:hypothetical protein J3R82DRAFT_3384 [Butyriboletus roseoflavus]